MKIRQFLEHHGIAENPFSDEDAQTDSIFKGGCIKSTYHPTWDKIYGNPDEPATAIVFGEKGSGKTALRLQIVRHLADYNAEHPESRVFAVEYDDFNPFLDRFRETLSGRRRRTERLLERWKLWDHMDAILSLGVTQLVDRILGVKQASHPAAIDQEPLAVDSLEPNHARDVLLLAACYDQSTAESLEDRWGRLRRKLKFHTWQSYWAVALGIVVTAATFGLVAWLGKWAWLTTAWPYLAMVAGWAPRIWQTARWFWKARLVRKNTRSLNHGTNALRRVLMKFPGRKISGQPLPAFSRTDDRYELLAKLQNVLAALDMHGIVVLVDRVDEPYLINGSADLMRAMLWPMLDNKFLKHPGIGVKLLLPIELSRFIDREDRDFHQRARLDKQNMVRSLEWTGQSLYSLADARLKASAVEENSPSLGDMFDEAIDKRRLIEVMGTMRVPRNLFKFLYQLIVAHINAHPDEDPAWRISLQTFETVLALYRRDQEAHQV